MSKRAIILAGGKGTRLKPYTISIPKPLVPIVDKPIIEIIIQQLVKSGFEHITITTNHMSDIIKAFCRDGSKWNTYIDYSQEDKPLSTMGPLKLINDLPDNFLVMNGDVLTDLDFDMFYSHHISNKSIFSISSFQRSHINNYGVLQVDGNCRLTKFMEKPLNKFEVSMGVYMANKKILDYIPEDTAYGFDHLMYDLLAAKQEINVKLHNSYWLDIGRPDDYERAAEDYEEIIKRTI